MAAEAEGVRLHSNPAALAAKAPDANGLATLARLAASSFEGVERELRAEIAQLQTSLLQHQAALGASAQGICVFDAEERLVLSNRRYAEIYRLAPEQIRPGMALREIVELRVAAGTYAAAAANEYLSFCTANSVGKQELIWSAELQDGRSIQMRTSPISKPNTKQPTNAYRYKP